MRRKIGYTGMKRCPDGEIYRFKKGIAKVPGMTFSRKPVYVTFKQFIEINSTYRKRTIIGAA